MISEIGVVGADEPVPLRAFDCHGTGPSVTAIRRWVL
jgi:hypothetical protein